jgi:uncharacterized protein YndB with AHSA1/START domain
VPSVTRGIDIEAPPSEVWRCMASQDALRKWLSPDIDVDLRVGGEYRFLAPDRETWITGVVLELVPEGRLVLSWLEEGAGWECPARLVVALEATATGTRVTLVHDGFAGIGKKWPDTLNAYERGADRHQVLVLLARAVAARGA